MQRIVCVADEQALTHCPRMSRLESAIRRLQAQKDCLNAVADMIAPVEGTVFELGLGNGRTFDHLRTILPTRDIYVFERKVAAHPDCVPDDNHLFEGDFSITLPRVEMQFQQGVALIHADVGSGDVTASKQLGAWLATVLPAFLVSGGILACDQDLTGISCDRLGTPDGVPAGRYYLYRKP